MSALQRHLRWLRRCLAPNPNDQHGSAIIELTWLGILLLVPVVYIVIAVFDVQRGAFASTAAARTAARAYALADDHTSGQRAAQVAAELAYADQGISEPVDVEVSCRAPGEAGDVTGVQACRLPGSVITVEVSSSVVLPFVPDALGGGRPSFALDAVHSVPYGQFRARTMTAPRSREDQRGQTTLLIVGFAGVLFMLLAVVVDASAAYLQRQGLATIADGAALAGADAGASGAEVYQGGLAAEGRIDQAAAAAGEGVDEYLRSINAYERYPGLSYATRIVEGTVQVTITAPLDLPLRVPGGPEEAQISATGGAALQLSG